MIYLFILTLILSLCCFWNIHQNFSLFLNLDLFLNNTSYWFLNIDLDNVTIFIVTMLTICFCYVVFYTNHYFNYSLEGNALNNIIILFVGVMMSLVCTGDFLLTLIFWEYLGVVSFFLILFYSNYLSLRASIITLVSSRFGDVSLFILIGLSVYLLNSWFIALILFFFIFFTKSAGFPFISWLLEAMRAPTPVSSLVHSSTLVAAGIWFIMRYDYLLYIDTHFFFSLMLILTILITGISSFFFLDLKKIVALSTCNNISWCIFYLIFGDLTLSLFQLVTHGVSKCMLFILVGDVMSGSSGSQNSNCVYSSSFYNNWNIFSLFSVILGLSGVPFIGVFFTKHFLLSQFNGVSNIFLSILVSTCVFISYFYSFRFCTILLNQKSSITNGVLYFFNSGIIIYFWLFINFFLCLNLDEISLLSTNNSLLLLLFQITCCITSIFFYNSCLLSNWSSSLFGCDNLIELIYKWFFLWNNTLYMLIYRWDNAVINNFNNLGLNSITHIFSNNNLNFTLFSFLLLNIWVIFYYF